MVFTRAGFSSWKNALVKGRGLNKHDESHNHKWCTLKAEMAASRTETICERLHDDVLKKRRQYVSSMIEVVAFLASNELAFRGEWNGEKEDGLFNNFVEFFLNKNDSLKACHDIMPKNAKYSSPDFQNEIIALLADEVRKSIVKDVSSAEYFTLLEDGTKNKKGEECICLAIRFVKNGRAHESVIDIISTTELHATAITDATIDALNSYGIDLSKMLCQCYDGASVMSGHKGGVQAQMQKRLGREIPYVHCYNHRLQLVVLKSLDNITLCNEFIENLKIIYDFFQLNNVKNVYDGHAITSLIVTRWSGHHRAVKSVMENFKFIIEALKSSKLKAVLTGEQKIMASGILNVLSELKFRFMCVFMNKVLGVLKPSDKMLQSRSFSLTNAISLISTVTKSVELIRTDDVFMDLMNTAYDIMPENDDQRPARTIKRPAKLSHSFILTDKTGERSSADIEIKSAFYETIDRICSEMRNRFDSNWQYLTAIGDSDEMNLEKLKPLARLKIVLPEAAEMEVAASYIKRLQAKQTEEQSSLLAELYNMRAALKHFRIALRCANQASRRSHVSAGEIDCQ